MVHVSIEPKCLGPFSAGPFSGVKKMGLLLETKLRAETAGKQKFQQMVNGEFIRGKRVPASNRKIFWTLHAA